MFGSVESGLRERYEQVGVNIARRRFLRGVVLGNSHRLFRLYALFGTNVGVRDRGQGGHAIRYRECERLIREGAVGRSFRVLGQTGECANFASIACCAFIVKIMTTIHDGIRYCQRAFLTKDRIAAVRDVKFFNDERSNVLASYPKAGNMRRQV